MQIDIAAVETTAGVELSGPPLRAGSWLRRLDAGLGYLVEIPAALLVLAEIAVLLGGVVSRYVFREPLVWSDELASILFLWLAMLGAVVAFRRAEHMRMTALVSRASGTFIETTTTSCTTPMPIHVRSRKRLALETELWVHSTPSP